MTLDELIPLVARLFSSKGYRYFTFGGVGVSLWGRPRTTRDLDVVVCVDKGSVPTLAADLRAAGFRITPPLQRKLAEGRIVQLPVGSTQLDIKLCAEGHDMEALARAKRAAFLDFELMVASPEDLVLYKLQTWRRQDQADIENLLSNAKGMDRRYIREHLGSIEQKTGHPVRERWQDIVRGA